METVHQIPALLQRISHALESSPYIRNRPVQIGTGDGEAVVLEGHVESFFQKQMAQEVIRRVDGVARIDNRLVVSY